MVDYLEKFQNSIDLLKEENRYREFVNISRICSEFPYAIDNYSGEKVVVWCSNDYLGMGQNQMAINSVIEVAKSYGVGSGGTRNISGTNNEVVKLEKELADLHNRDMSLTFVSGYVANDASIQAIAKIMPDLVIFSDAKNHASIISGIRNSRLEKNIFRHNDLEHLEELLKKYPKSQKKIIIFESVYSMDGDFGDVEGIVKLAKEYNCLTFCDEVHGVGIYGKKGRGYCSEIGMDEKIDIIQGTLAKAYGVIGGFIVGKSEIIDAIRLYSSGFIFSTALPPMIAAASYENVCYLRDNDELRDLHRQKVKLLKKLLESENIDIVGNKSHIVSIKVSGAKRVEEISRRLREEFKIYVQHINYPTVDPGDERLRVTVTPLHSDEMIREFVLAVKECLG